MSEVANFLKMGTTSLVLAMIEDDWFARAGREFALRRRCGAMRRVSYDLSLSRPLDLADGRTMTALELQWEHLDLARKYAEERGLDAVGGDEIGREILRRWEEVLTGLESDPMTLAKQLDWVAKYRIVNGYRERHGLRLAGPQAGRHGPAVSRRHARSDRCYARARDRAAPRSRGRSSRP